MKWPLLLAVALGVSCASADWDSVEPDARDSRPYADADVRFMQGMIHHHAQAIAMTDLVDDRTASESIRQAGQRIEISQRDEIARMRRWLEARGEEVPSEHEHFGPLMPGMLTDEQMAQLAAARAAEFDRLFLELMIQHHEGALVMVRELAAQQGAAQEPEIYLFVSDVDADQRAEIARMRGMLSTSPQGGTE